MPQLKRGRRVRERQAIKRPALTRQIGYSPTQNQGGNSKEKKEKDDSLLVKR